MEESRDSDLALSDQAHRLIRRAILSGELTGGQRIKMAELRRLYSFSSTPLREALNRLATEGLVVTDNNRGFRVASISNADLADITSFRLVVELDALGQSVARGDDNWEAEIIAAFHRLDRLHGRVAPNEGSLTDEWTARHKAFHMALIGACPSQRQRAMCSSLFDQAERYRRLSISIRKIRRDSMAEHRAIMDATLAREADRAVRLLGDHITRTSSNVTEMLDARARGERVTRPDDRPLHSPQSA